MFWAETGRAPGHLVGLAVTDKCCEYHPFVLTICFVPYVLTIEFTGMLSIVHRMQYIISV